LKEERLHTTHFPILIILFYKWNEQRIKKRIVQSDKTREPAKATLQLIYNFKWIYERSGDVGKNVQFALIYCSF
jgi:hypothetical protein